LWCSPRLCLGSHPFHNVCLTHCFNRIISRCHQQHYADDTQLFLFLSPASLSSSLGSLQRYVSSLHSRVLHNGVVLNPTTTGAICFDTNPILQSLCNLTSIEVVGTSVHLARRTKTKRRYTQHLEGIG
jgi:hypothetical protein